MYFQMIDSAPPTPEETQVSLERTCESASIFNKNFHTTHVFKQDTLSSTCIPIVSVGSGMGVAEKLIQEKFKNRRVICVDPAPESFGTYPKDLNQCIQPHYATVEDLIAQEPDVVHQCVVILIWPLYTNAFDPKNKPPYDIAALVKLQPLGTFIFYDYTGASGSELMIHWIDTQFPHLKLNFKSQSPFDKAPFMPRELVSIMPKYNVAKIWYSWSNKTNDWWHAKRYVGLWMERVSELGENMDDKVADQELGDLTSSLTSTSIDHAPSVMNDKIGSS